MEMNFNGKEFNSTINSNSTNNNSLDFENGKKVLIKNIPFVLGIISFALSFINLPFGLFMNFSTSFLNNLIGKGITHWIFALFVITGVIITLSILCGVFAIILFAKTNKTTLNYIGFTISIISFVMCALCLGLNIAGIAAW